MDSTWVTDEIYDINIQDYHLYNLTNTTEYLRDLSHTPKS